MNEFAAYSKYFFKVFTSLKLVVTKPAGIVAVAPVLAIAPAIDAVDVAWVLLGLFVLDFATGIWASWVEFEKAKPVTPASGILYMLRSTKLRMSGAKFVTYGLIIIVGYCLELIFITKEFELHPSIRKMTIPVVGMLFCCIVELYSIIFENMPRIGFDLVQYLKNMFKTGWGVYKSVKNEKTE